MTVSTEATSLAVLCRCIHSAVLRPQPNLGSPSPIQAHCPLSITAPMIEYKWSEKGTPLPPVTGNRSLEIHTIRISRRACHRLIYLIFDLKKPWTKPKLNSGQPSFLRRNSSKLEALYIHKNHWLSVRCTSFT